MSKKKKKKPISKLHRLVTEISTTHEDREAADKIPQLEFIRQFPFTQIVMCGNEKWPAWRLACNRHNRGLDVYLVDGKEGKEVWLVCRYCLDEPDALPFPHAQLICTENGVELGPAHPPSAV